MQWAEVQAAARAAGRDPAALTGAMYLTLAIDDDAARADARLNAYLEQYYGMPPRCDAQAADVATPVPPPARPPG